jgi:glycosyltransferase involved in cell wall biosynthesis
MDAKNRNAFQKPYRLCKRYKTDILAKERIGAPCEIDNQALSINILKGYEKIYPIVFPIWATCKILRSQGFKSRIYTDWHNTSLLTGFILSVLGATWVADVWDNPKKRLLSWKEKKANVPIYKRIYHEVQGALISLYLKKAAVIFSCVPHLDQIYSINKKKLIYHTNGVDLEFTKPDYNGNNTKRFCIIYVGPIETVRLRHIKSLIENVYLEIKQFEIKLIGPVGDENLVDDVRSDLPDGVVVNFTGWKNHLEVLSEISKAHVCLLPYPDALEIKNYQPIKLFEYMAMGKIVVASRLPGIEKIVKHGKTGFLYDPHDTKAAAEIIRKIKKNPELEKIIGVNAREEMKNYDWASIIDKTFEHLPY